MLTRQKAAPLSGLAYCLIIVRFGIGGAFKTNGPAPSTVFLPSSRSSRSDASRVATRKPVAINVTRELETVGIDDVELVAKTPQADAFHHPQTYSYDRV